MFTIKDIYPNFGVIDTAGVTIPETAEQATLQQSDITAAPAVSTKQKNTIWFGLAIVVILLVCFHYAK